MYIETTAPRSRTIAESLDHGHEAVSRAEGLVSRILDILEGPRPEKGSLDSAFTQGLVRAADLLPGRVESLIADLLHIEQVLRDSPKAMLGNTSINGIDQYATYDQQLAAQKQAIADLNSPFR